MLIVVVILASFVTQHNHGYMFDSQALILTLDPHETLISSLSVKGLDSEALRGKKALKE